MGSIQEKNTVCTENITKDTKHNNNRKYNETHKPAENKKKKNKQIQKLCEWHRNDNRTKQQNYIHYIK